MTRQMAAILFFLALALAGCATPAKGVKRDDVKAVSVALGFGMELNEAAIRTWLESMPEGERADAMEMLYSEVERALFFLLRQPGAVECDLGTGLTTSQRKYTKGSTEYCMSGILIINGDGTASFRFGEPVAGRQIDRTRGRCTVLPVIDVQTRGKVAVRLLTVHNHPCFTPPSSGDYLLWGDGTIPSERPEATSSGGQAFRPGGMKLERRFYMAGRRPDGKIFVFKFYPTGETFLRDGGKWRKVADCIPDVQRPKRAPLCYMDGKQVNLDALILKGY